MRQPRAGHDYPRSTGEFQSWFATDADCLDYLEWLRWPDGFVCPRCDHAGGWAVGDGRYKCAGCWGAYLGDRGHPVRPAADAADGVVHRLLDVRFAEGRRLGVEPAADAGDRLLRHRLAMLHRLRSVLVRPGRDRLTGRVEVDETFIGGEEPGLSGGRAKGKKSLVAVAVEVHEPRGYGRVRMGIIADASAACLHPFITANVEPGGTVITDGWQGYSGIERFGYTRDRRSQRAARARGEDPGELLPGVHRVASLAKRWLLGTHQGSVDEAHLQSYLDEFTFRFNRRRSSSRGM